MPAIFFASSRPPTRPSAICRIEAARCSSTRANSYLVVRRSPVAIGIEVARATSAISSGIAGGIELHGREALLHVLGRPLRGELGIVVDRVRVLALRIDVGVGPQPLMHL